MFASQQERFLTLRLGPAAQGDALDAVGRGRRERNWTGDSTLSLFRASAWSAVQRGRALGAAQLLLYSSKGASSAARVRQAQLRCELALHLRGLWPVWTAREGTLLMLR